jgi:hypothetical protein
LVLISGPVHVGSGGYFVYVRRWIYNLFTKTVLQEKLMKYGPLPIRILAGIIFIAHGIPKLVNIPGTQHFFLTYNGISTRNGSYHCIVRNNWRVCSTFWYTDKNIGNTLYN